MGKMCFKVAQYLLAHVLMYYFLATTEMTAIELMFLVFSLNKDFWLNTFSSSVKNNCNHLFTVAWNSTRNTIVSTHRFSLNSDIGINPGLFRKGKCERGKTYPWSCECKQTCKITVLISAFVTRDEGSQ